MTDAAYKRNGPRPLAAHIGMAVSNWSAKEGGGTVAGYAPDAQNISARIESMLLGIQRYQNHNFVPSRPQRPICWQQGEVTLRIIPDCIPDGSRPILLLIPSMINRGYILDLMEGRSLMAYIQGHGFCPVLLEWGESTADDAQHTIAGAIHKRLLEAINYLVQERGGPIHALGYCMGGTMLAGALSLKPSSFASAVLMAAPWDFHAGSGSLLRQVQFWSPSAFPVIAEKGRMDVDWMQMLFASLDPDLTAQKFMRFAGMQNDTEKERMFIAVEDWLNDGVDLPGGVAIECLQGWFLENTPACGQWRLGDKVVRPSDHDRPVLVIASSGDRLVEKDTAAAYARQAKRADILDPCCGHIGMIASRRGIDDLWWPVVKWLHAHCAAQ